MGPAYEMSPFTVLASTVAASTPSSVISPFTVSAMISPVELATSTSSFTELTLIRPLAPLQLTPSPGPTAGR